VSPELIEFSSVVMTIAGLFGLCMYVIVSVVLAQATSNDADRLRESGREPQVLGSVGWALLVLVTNVIGFAVYWVMHYSVWRDPATDRQVAGRKP
jgi:hypothetical protein